MISPIKGIITHWEGIFISDETGKTYRVEKGQSALLKQEMIKNGYNHLLERDKEDFPWRSYTLEGIPVLFIPSGRNARQGKDSSMPYATDLKIDKERLVA